MKRSHLILSCLTILATSLLTTSAATMNKPKVFISNPTVPDIALQILGLKCDLIIAESDTVEEILAKVKGVDGIYWATHQPLNKEILNAAGPQMKTVVAMSAGYNNIDTAELKARGIKLGNTPGVLNAAVADIAMLLALGASRRMHDGRLHIEEGTWSPSFNIKWMVGQDISGSTVGIIGLGNIGQAIAKRLKGFEVARILYTGHREKPEGKELGAKFVNLDTLTKESDFIFLSAPLTNETRGMCDEDFFSKMKKTGIFINISRGALVDQDALIKALKENRIFAAGLDVMTPEPLPKNHELLKLRNVVLTPHVGSATLNTRNAMAELAAQNMLRGLGGAEMFTPVDL